MFHSLCGHPPVVMFFFLQSTPCLLVAGLILSPSLGSAFRRLSHALGEHSHHFPWHHRPGHMGCCTLPCRMGHAEPSSLCSQVPSGCGAGRQGRFSPARSQTQAPFSPQPRTVLELGSGAGLTGLAICKTCRPSAYIFSDCHSCVLEQLRGNILLNGLSLEADVTDPARHPEHNTCNSESPRVTVAQLDWDVVTAPQLAAFQPDVVIAAGTAPHPRATGAAPPSSQLWEGDSGCCQGRGVMRFLEGPLWASRVTSKHSSCPLEAIKPQPSHLTQWTHVLLCKWSHQINEPSFSQQSLTWKEQAPGHQTSLTY